MIEESQVNNDYQTNSNKSVIPESDYVNERFMKLVVTADPSSYVGNSDSLGDAFVFVADTGNHCI